jgi:hypothetical protein
MPIEDAVTSNSIQEEPPNELVIAFVYAVGTACNPVLDTLSCALSRVIC